MLRFSRYQDGSKWIDRRKKGNLRWLEWCVFAVDMSTCTGSMCPSAWFQALLLHRWCGPLWQPALWIITCRNQRCNDGAVDGGCVPDTCNLKNTKNTGKGDQWRLCFGNDVRRSHSSFWQFVTPLWPFFFVNPPLNHSSVSSKSNTSSQIHPGFNNNTSPI